MKKETFEKAQEINNRLNNIKNYLKKLNNFEKNLDKTHLVLDYANPIFGDRTSVALSKETSRQILDILSKECEENLKQAEKEFENV